MSTAKKSSRKTSGLFPPPRVSDIRDGRTLNRNGARVSNGITYGANLSDFVKFIPISETSMEPDTGEQLCQQAGFLASHFPRPGSEEARKTTATSGRKCSGLYMRPGPLGSLVRTLLESSTWISTLC